MLRFFKSTMVPNHSRRMRDVIARWLGSVGAARTSADPPPLLLKRLELLGIDPAFLSVAQPDTLRRLTARCRNCAHTEACAADLGVEDVAAGMDTYCANGDAIDDLVIKRANG